MKRHIVDILDLEDFVLIGLFAALGLKSFVFGCIQHKDKYATNWSLRDKMWGLLTP